MALSVYEFRDYRKFLGEFLRGRGRRSDLAKAIGCHSAYVSRVLGGVADLSLEQAFQTSGFFGQSAEESEYFLLLVQHARAGTPALRGHWQRQIEAKQSEHLKLDRRLEGVPTIAEPDRLTYYSSWYYAAVHIATAVPELRTVEAISAYLRVPVATVRKALGFLVSLGMVIEEKGRYRIGKTHIHVDSTSEGSRQHHRNWRLRSITALDAGKEDDVHYTSVISCSRKDLPKIRQVMVEAVEQIRAVVRASGDDVVCAYLLDLIETGHEVR